MFRSKKQAAQTLATATHVFSPKAISFSLNRCLVSPGDPSLSATEAKLCEDMTEGNALVKILPNEIINSEHGHAKPWPLHLDNLKKGDQETTSNPNDWTYDHSTGLIEIGNDDERKLLSSRGFTTSTTLVSRNLNTALFTAFNIDAAPAGLVYSRHQDCHIVAMFTNADEAHTFDAVWASTDLNAVIKQKEKLADIRFNDFEAFQKHIDEHGAQTCNEVIAKVNRNSVRGLIFDVTEMPNGYRNFAAEKAREKRKEVFNTLGMELPVVFYHATKNQISVYTRDEQDLDELKVILEQKLADNYQSRHLPSLSLFAPEDLSYSVDVPGFIKCHIDRKTAQEVIQLINGYQKMGMSAPNAKDKVKAKCGLVDHMLPNFVV